MSSFLNLISQLLLILCLVLLGFHNCASATLVITLQPDLSNNLVVSLSTSGATTTDVFRAMAGVLEQVVGPWGAALISLGLIVSVAGAFLSWTLLAAEIPFVAGSPSW